MLSSLFFVSTVHACCVCSSRLTLCTLRRTLGIAIDHGHDGTQWGPSEAQLDLFANPNYLWTANGVRKRTLSFCCWDIDHSHIDWAPNPMIMLVTSFFFFLLLALVPLTILRASLIGCATCLPFPTRPATYCCYSRPARKKPARGFGGGEEAAHSSSRSSRAHDPVCGHRGCTAGAAIATADDATTKPVAVPPTLILSAVVSARRGGRASAACGSAVARGETGGGGGAAAACAATGAEVDDCPHA